MPKRRALSDRQRKFVSEYLIHLNATKAAMRAGYSPRSAADIGHALLRRHEAVMSAIAAAMAERERRTQVTADRIVTELARIAFADIRSFADWGKDGVVDLRPLAELSADDAAAVAEVYGPGKAGGRPKLKLHDKRAALELLARHMGLVGTRRPSPPLRPAGPELPAREVLRRKLAQMAGETDQPGGAA